MRKFYVSALAVMACFASFSQPVITATGGDWKLSSSWTVNEPQPRIPRNGDIINIPAGITTTLSDGLTTNLSNVQLNVNGTLSLSTKDTKLSLTFSSISVNSSTSGRINRTGGTQDITYATSSSVFTSGNTVTTGNFGTYIALPVKFSGFSVARQNSDVLVQWSTAEEVNALSFEVERSTDGNTWNRIANVPAKGNSSSLTNYTYSDKNVTAAVAYYRIKQVDIDGKSIYTAIQSVKATAAGAEVKVAAISNRLVVQFPSQVKGAVEVRVVSLAGQVISKQVLRQPVGQVILNTPTVKGAYIISVSNAQEINVAKQVVL